MRGLTIVTSVQQGDSESDVPSEQFSLNFAKVEMSYFPQGAKGKLGPSVTAGTSPVQVTAYTNAGSDDGVPDGPGTDRERGVGRGGAGGRLRKAREHIGMDGDRGDARAHGLHQDERCALAGGLAFMLSRLIPSIAFVYQRKCTLCG